MTVENGGDVRDVAAGVDDNRLMRFFIAEDGAVALKRSDREYNVKHGKEPRT
jgi:hypothetical protein